MLRAALILLYSALLSLLAPLLRAAAGLSPRLAAQLRDRPTVAEAARLIAPARALQRRCVVFYCSSAGEFEQARPLIDRLARLGSVYVHVVFFSKAGLEYVQARGETVPCSLSPVTDSVWEWGWLLAALRPDVVAVVRHELWPGFLDTARHYAKLYLIDASASPGEARSRLKRAVRSRLLRTFDRIYTASATDARFFRQTYGLAPDRLLAVGDTKYDRALERAQAKAADAGLLKARLDRWAPAAAARRLVLGSAYRQEVDLLLAALALDSTLATRWQVVVAPHQISEEMVAWALERCRGAGLATVRYSERAALPEGGAPPAAVVVLDTMGMLAEVYGTADAALIGGALRNKVHNVLEPACHGLALAFGPFYKNSQEAAHLVEAGLAQVVAEPAAFVGWWKGLEAHGSRPVERTVEAVATLTGASDRIMAEWRPLLED